MIITLVSGALMFHLDYEIISNSIQYLNIVDLLLGLFVTLKGGMCMRLQDKEMGISRGEYGIDAFPCYHRLL